jgi:ABC-type Na+ efflux pump permease subunit
VFFRADSLSTAFAFLGRLFTGWTTPTTLVTPVVVLVIFGVLALQQIPGRPSVRFQYVFSRLTPALQGVLLAGALFVITTLGPQGVAPFIYFQF